MTSMIAQKTYETGMRIIFNESARTASVAFRGRLTVLSGPFADEDQARAAGEEFCRQRGWIERVPAAYGRSLLHRSNRPL